MMERQAESLIFTVPLGVSAHRRAKQFSQQQTAPQKIKRVYLNTLAVYAVDFYLKCIGFETDLAASDSWNPVMRTLMDVADLDVKKLGKLECRPVLPDSQIVRIAPEVWSDRIGYIAVQTTESLTEATLLGFVKNVTAEELPLKELRSLDSFLEYLNALRDKPVVKLSQWLNNIVDEGWEDVKELLQPQQVELAFRGRGPGAERGKRLELESAGERISLLVGLDPVDETEMNIWVEVYPSRGQSYLPKNLQLNVLDSEGASVMEAVARNTNKNIQFEFKGELGESFNVKVALGNVSVTEAFTI